MTITNNLKLSGLKQQPWASLIAQLVKNPPAMQETLGSIPGLGIFLEEGMATHSSIIAWRIPMNRGAWQAPWGHKESDTTE